MRYTPLPEGAKPASALLTAEEATARPDHLTEEQWLRSVRRDRPGWMTPARWGLELARRYRRGLAERQEADGERWARCEAGGEEGDGRRAVTVLGQAEADRRNFLRAAGLAAGAANLRGVGASNYPVLLQHLAEFCDVGKINPRYLAKVRNQLVAAGLAKKPRYIDARPTDPVPHWFYWRPDEEESATPEAVTAAYDGAYEEAAAGCRAERKKAKRAARREKARARQRGAGEA